jgi:hypothetical protein
VREYTLANDSFGPKRGELSWDISVMTMNATNRDALIQALTECRKQLDYFASFLEGYDEEFMTLLRSAAENIKSPLERLKPIGR